MVYKLTLYALAEDTSPQALAEGVIENYGADFDAARGDFIATVVEGTVEIVAKQVAKGDMRTLREDIYRDFGDEDESMMIRASYSDGVGWFPVDLDADDD